MSVTLTWDDGKTSASLVISDEVLTALEALRKTQITISAPGVVAPTYATVKQMVLGELYRTLVSPALSNPGLSGTAPAAVRTARTNLDAAQAAYDAALKGAVPNLVP